MLHHLWRRRALIAWSLVFTLLFNAFAPAYGGFSLPFGLEHTVKDKAHGEIYKRAGEALGLSDPLLLDQKSAFKKVKDIADFNPTHHVLTSVKDLFAPLGVGDHSFDMLIYCAQGSIHAPAQGIGYKLGVTQGKEADIISALLIRGSLLGIEPHQLQAVSWRIQGGVPIGAWSKEDKALADRLIPEHEDRLKGDLLQEYQQRYAEYRAAVPGNVLPSTLDEVLPKLGLVGKNILAMEKARKTLEDKTISAERLPDRLYEQAGTNDGLPRVLPAPSTPESSPWGEIKPGIFGQLMITGGNLAVNRLNIRITPEALKAQAQTGKVVTSIKSGVKTAIVPFIVVGEILLEAGAAEGLAGLAGEALTEEQLLQQLLKRQVKSLIGYSVRIAAQIMPMAPFFQQNLEMSKPPSNKSPNGWSKGEIGDELKNEERHWNDHKNEFPKLSSKEQYTAAAKQLIETICQRTPLFCKVRPNGQTMVYESVTNTFAVQTKDGLLVTMFKPTEKIQYWLGQLRQWGFLP